MRWLTAVSLVLMLAGCGLTTQPGDANDDPAAADTSDGSAEAVADEGSDDEGSSPDPHQVAEPAPSRAVTVALTGDVHGEAQVAQLLEGGGNPLDDVAAELSAADLAIANLETAVGSAGTPAPKQFTFQASPTLLDALASGGIDAVSVANNHSLDFGVEGLAETVDLAREAGLAVVGGGQSRAEAYAPHYADIDGQVVGVVGLTRVIPVPEWAAGDERPGLASVYEPGLPDALAAIEEAEAEADWVVVAVHWGQEGSPCPDEVQTGLARRFVDAGADVVAGHHPHVLQGVQETDGAVVAYSLGNFVWYAGSEEARSTGVLTVELDPADGATWDFAPARIDDTGSPQALAGADPEAAEELSRTVSDRSPGGSACADVDWP